MNPIHRQHHVRSRLARIAPWTGLLAALAMLISAIGPRRTCAAGCMLPLFAETLPECCAGLIATSGDEQAVFRAAEECPGIVDRCTPGAMLGSKDGQASALGPMLAKANGWFRAARAKHTRWRAISLSAPRVPSFAELVLHRSLCAHAPPAAV